MLRVSDDHRRARIGRRHGLAAEHRHPDIGTATSAMTALHATEPSTPHLSVHARVVDVTVADVEAALYDERSIVKVMAMRRTLFVVTRDLVAAAVGSAGRRVADAGRRRLAKETTDIAARLGGGWMDDACSAIVEALRDRELSARELRDALPHLGSFTSAAGTAWAAEVATVPRLLTILHAGGDVTRGRNAGHWRLSRPMWTTAANWLGTELEPLEPADGYAELVRGWLWSFGPGTEADLVWWLGATKGIVRAALTRLEAVPVEFDDGTAGWVLPDDTDDLTRPAEREPWVALAPTLDPTTMGWRDRGFYLDRAHVPALFDSVGNGGTTVWVDGRIVGCWVQDAAEHVRLVLLEDVPRATQRRLDSEVERLDAFIGGEHITNVFASPQMRT